MKGAQQIDVYQFRLFTLRTSSLYACKVSGSRERILHLFKEVSRVTQNQVAYWQLQETERSNQAREKEAERSNRAQEALKKKQNEIAHKNMVISAVKAPFEAVGSLSKGAGALFKSIGGIG